MRLSNRQRKLKMKVSAEVILREAALNIRINGLARCDTDAKAQVEALVLEQDLLSLVNVERGRKDPTYLERFAPGDLLIV